MKRSAACRLAALAAALLTAGATAVALAAQVHNPTFGSAAVLLVDGSVRLAATVGEAGPVGRANGGGWMLLEGFWHPGVGYASAVAPEPPQPGADGLVFRNALAASRPNPFSDGTRVAFSVARAAPVALDIYDLGGRRVRRLLSGTFAAGRFESRWDGRDDRGAELPSGLYHARLRIGSWSATSRLMMVR